VLGQLGNRVQHALRAFTPKDQKAVKAAAETLRPNPKLKVAEVITELGVGEALVSLLDEKGRPGVVERAFVVPPGSRLGPLDAAERKAVIESSIVYGHYEKAIDRDSAYEKLKARAAEKQAQAPAGQSAGAAACLTTCCSQDRAARRQAVARHRRGHGHQRRALDRSGVGREILRGVLGSILGKKR